MIWSYLLIFLALATPFCYFLYKWRQEYVIRKYSTSTIIGKVVTHREWVSLRPPIIEYEVDGIKYRKALEYSWVVYGPKDILYPHDIEELRNYMLESKKLYNIGLMPYNMYQLFPIGYELTVRYNPKQPQLAYVERYAGGEALFRVFSLFYIVVLFFLCSLLIFIAI
ncbi:DUF3592 domain-containing protein [Streptococcus suis]|uniref:DUF3592 domain-containing protein n=1 Tax=Streptococcus suis TaxID=1307 RepID=UPI000CF3A6BC|nr:DUF3592 domain-containing protein [Streptococcus suis]